MTLYEDMTNDMEGIKARIRKGYISCTFIKHYQVYKCYLCYLTEGHNVSTAVKLTSEDMKVNESWIYNIIKKMEEEI